MKEQSGTSEFQNLKRSISIPGCYKVCTTKLVERLASQPFLHHQEKTLRIVVAVKRIFNINFLRPNVTAWGPSWQLNLYAPIGT